MLKKVIKSSKFLKLQNVSLPSCDFLDLKLFQTSSNLFQHFLTFYNHGLLGNLLKSGLRFSRNAFLPSCPSCVM